MSDTKNTNQQRRQEARKSRSLLPPSLVEATEADVPEVRVSEGATLGDHLVVEANFKARHIRMEEVADAVSASRPSWDPTVSNASATEPTHPVILELARILGRYAAAGQTSA